MTSETGRIEAFSDGVFSIAATLLVLDLKAPPANQEFWHGLSAQWPGFASFLLSFLFIGIMWINHHRLFTHVRRVDDALMGVNLLLLIGVVWIPYATSVMGASVTSGRGRQAALLYNSSYLGIALLYNLLLFTCIRRRLVDREYEGVRNIARAYVAGPLLYGVCVAVTWWSVPASLLMNGAMAIYFLLSPERRRKKASLHAGR